MYDYLLDKELRCPFCGYTLHIEIQTKETEGQLLLPLAVHYDDPKKCEACHEPNVFSPEETISHAVPSDSRFNYIQAIGDCKSPPCYAIARMNQFIRSGYVSGFGRLFHLEYPVKDGIVVGPGKVVEDDRLRNNQDDYEINEWSRLEELFKAKLKEKGPKWVESFDKVLNEKAHGQFAIAVLLWHDWLVEPGT